MKCSPSLRWCPLHVTSRRFNPRTDTCLSSCRKCAPTSIELGRSIQIGQQIVPRLSGTAETNMYCVWPRYSHLPRVPGGRYSDQHAAYMTSQPFSNGDLKRARGHSSCGTVRHLSGPEAVVEMLNNDGVILVAQGRMS